MMQLRRGKRAKIVASQDSDTQRLLFEHAQFHLNNELNISASLRDSRKVLSALLAIVLGIGLYRMDIHRQPGEITVIPAWSELVIRILFALSCVAFLLGIVFLYTERPVFDSAPRERQGALTGLYFPDEVLDALGQGSPWDVYETRTKVYRLAYKRLRAANNAVRRRLTIAGVFFFGGIGALFLSFCIYFWTIEVEGIHG